MTREEFKKMEKDLTNYLDSLTDEAFVSSVQSHFASAPWHDLFEFEVNTDFFIESSYEEDLSPVILDSSSTYMDALKGAA